MVVEAASILADRRRFRLPASLPVPSNYGWTGRWMSAPNR